jgi:transposase-like protein
MASSLRTSRQRWSNAFKKRIVAEASHPGETVPQMARRYDLDAHRVSNWMKKFGSGIALIQQSSQVRLVGYGQR